VDVRSRAKSPRYLGPRWMSGDAG